MNELKKQMSLLIEEKIRSTKSNTKAMVLEHDIDFNTATIKYEQGDGQEITRSQVPIRVSDGVSTPKMSLGTLVYVEFINYNYDDPIIVSVADEDYQASTRRKQKHERKGAYIPDCIVDRGDF